MCRQTTAFLDHNQLKAFPRDRNARLEANDDKHNRPSVPFPTRCGQQRNAKDFGSIGHLYHCIQAYLDLEYDDKDQPLGQAVCTQLSSSRHVRKFKSQAAGHPDKKSIHFPVTFEGWNERQELAKQRMTLSLRRSWIKAEGAQTNSRIPQPFCASTRTSRKKTTARITHWYALNGTSQSHYDPALPWSILG